MTRHIVRAAFINKVDGAKFYPKGGQPETDGDDAEGKKPKVRNLTGGERIVGPGEFESPDAEQVERLTRAGCLVPATEKAKPAPAPKP